MGAYDLTIGPMILGFSINMYLYGFVTYQYISYKTMEFEDPAWLRALVGILFAIDSSQTIVEGYCAWYFAIENYTNPSVLSDIIWPTPFICVATAVSALMVQTFLISRLYRLTRQSCFCLFLVLAAVAAFLCGIIDCVKAWRLRDTTKFVTLLPLTTAWLAIESGVDIIITVALSRALWRSRTGISRTNTIINRILLRAIYLSLRDISLATWEDIFKFSRKELSKIAYGVTETTRSSTFPGIPQTTSIRFHREIASDSMVANGDTKTSLDQTIILPRSQNAESA
ncbi:hypothetical protein DL96DRAFT_1749863 [Flagelloscypha sp. PMI_526]|nr:hypothetical protein DL96DRAFT_1749863 [Flagelloscypha sp. PMI_526]